MGCIIKGYKAHMCCQGGGIRHLRNMRTMFTNRLHFLAIYSLFAAFTSTWGINQINIHIKMIELHSWTKKQSGLAGGCTCVIQAGERLYNKKLSLIFPMPVFL